MKYFQSLVYAAEQAPVSVHEWGMAVSITTILWGVIVLLGTALTWYALGDRSEIKDSLKRLVEEVRALRMDLLENYAKKIDIEKLDRKVERLRDHMTVRGQIADSEDG